MSIPTDIVVGGEGLVELPTLFGAPVVRRILVTPTMFSQIESLGHSALVTPMAVLREDLDHFTSGGLMTVGFRPHKDCRIKHLDPEGDEIWEFRCFRKGDRTKQGIRPGARVLGRFLAPDMFVATNMADRDELSFDLEIRKAKAEWRKLFPGGREPFRGGTVHDYITRDAVDLRDLD